MDESEWALLSDMMELLNKGLLHIHVHVHVHVHVDHIIIIMWGTLGQFVHDVVKIYMYMTCTSYRFQCNANVHVNVF